MPNPRLSPQERLAARLITSPPAFLIAGVIDFTTLLTRYLLARRKSD